MDPSDPSMPAERMARIETLLERASRLTDPEIVTLIGVYREGGMPGMPEPGAMDARRSRARLVASAIARSGRRHEAVALTAAASSAVRAAPGLRGHARRLAQLGLLCDAELAVADAGLAILLEDHLPEQSAAALARPFAEATGDGLSDPKVARR